MTDTEYPSGVALIVVDARGENAIAVAPGANGNVTPDDVHRARTVITSSDILVVQLEVPVESIRAAVVIAASAGVPCCAQPRSGAATRRRFAATSCYHYTQ